MREVRRDKQGRPLRYHSHVATVDGRRVEIRFALVEERMVCVGLEIGPPVIYDEEQNSYVFDVDEDAELDELRSTDVRLPLRKLRDEALTHAVAPLSPPFLPTATAARLKKHRAVAEKGMRKPGRPPLYGDDHYREVARIYEETLRRGRRDPLQAIMRDLRIEKTTAASKVREARRRGFLTMTYFRGQEKADA